MVKIRDKNELKCPKIGFKRVGWYISTLLILPISLYAETTNNLLNQQIYDGNNFANGWSGTNDHNHGNAIVAGVDGEYIENSISLQNDAGLSKGIINNGFTSTAGADIWFWNQIEQNVEITQTLVDDNGNVTTQTKTINNDGCYYCTHTDSIVIGNNSQEDYDITVRYTFNENSNSISHYGADLKSPTLFIEYDPVVMSAVTQNAITEVSNNIQEIEIEEFVYEQPVIEEVVVEEIVVETIEETISLEEEQFIEETIVLSSEVLEPEVVEEVNEEIVVEEVYEEILAEAPIEQTEEISNEEETIEETEGDTNIDESNSDIVTEETETNNESGSVETELTIEDITIKVADKIKTTEGQLKAVSLIVAKVMSNNNKIDSYSQVNAEIFKQPVIMDRNIDTYLNQTYVDVRNIYNDKIYEDRVDWISR